MTNALQDPVRIFTRKFLAVRVSVRGRPVEITGNSDCGHTDNGAFEKLLFEMSMATRSATRSSLIISIRLSPSTYSEAARDAFRIEVGLTAELIDPLGKKVEMLLLLLRVLSELCFSRPHWRGRPR